MSVSRNIVAAAAALIALSMGACNRTATSSAPTDTAKVAATIKANVGQMIAAYNAHDAAKGVQFDSPDGVWMFHGQPNIVGKSADLTSTQQMHAADPTTHWTASNESVDVSGSGDMAVYHSVYTFTFTDPNTKAYVTERGNYLQGWKRQADGSWQLTWVIGSDLPPATGVSSTK